MDRLFRQSGLYREKWDREDYAERTISEAIAGCNEVYNPAAYSQKQALQSFVSESIPQFYDGKTFLHNVMGDYLIKTLGVCKINGTLHVYKNGVYVPDEDAIHGEMIKLCRRIRDTQRKEVYKYIKACPETPVKKISPPHLIPFKSRIYNLHDGTFIDYSPEYVFLNRFPYDYKPYAPEQPSITRVIEEIACGDRDIINLLYEAMGNCFYLLNSYRGAVMLYGRSGNNGKSTLLNIILQLVGVENASSLALQDTAERFRLYGIYGKAANIGDDIPETYLPDTSIFKKLVTGEPVIAEQKGQDPVTFKSYAKLFFSMNTLPRVNDKSRAFFSRILLIPLNKDFSAGKQDVSLKNREWSESEMECLVCHAMDERLTRNGGFTRPASVTEALREYELENNPVLEFLEEEQPELEGRPTSEVYQSFKYWCALNGKRELSHCIFSKEVISATGLKNPLHRIGGKPQRVFSK